MAFISSTVNNAITDGCQTLPGHVNEPYPLLMLLVTLVLFCTILPCLSGVQKKRRRKKGLWS